MAYRRRYTSRRRTSRYRPRAPRGYSYRNRGRTFSRFRGRSRSTRRIPGGFRF